GLMAGDVVLQLNGQAVQDSRTLSLQISNLAPGTKVQMHISRDGKESDIGATLGEAPAISTAESEKSEAPGHNRNDNEGQAGISVEQLTPQIVRPLGLQPSTAGVVVDDVQATSPAESAGLQRGDVIQEINHKPIRNVADFQNTMRSLGNGSFLLLINRGGS